MKKKKHPNGFSFIELLIALTIFSLMSAAVYSTFSQGTKLWAYALREQPEWKIDIFMEQFSNDLRNIFENNPNSFLGTKDSVQFFALAPHRGIKSPAGVRYFFSKEDRAIYRAVESYEEMSSKHAATEKSWLSPALNDIEDMQLEYYRFDSTKGVHGWISKWVEDCLPKTVKVSLSYQGRVKKNESRYINIPASNGCTEQKA